MGITSGQQAEHRSHDSWRVHKEPEFQALFYTLRLVGNSIHVSVSATLT